MRKFDDLDQILGKLGPLLLWSASSHSVNFTQSLRQRRFLSVWQPDG